MADRHLSYDTAHADLHFQLVSMRHEKKPPVLTTNLPFKQWPTLFPGAGCTVALIDRVVHHAEVITVEGESDRLREAKASSSKRRSSRRKKTAKWAVRDFYVSTCPATAHRIVGLDPAEVSRGLPRLHLGTVLDAAGFADANRTAQPV